MGGFINSYTVPQTAFRKLGKSRPGDIYNFRQISVEQAQAMAREMKALCMEASII